MNVELAVRRGALKGQLIRLLTSVRPETQKVR
jgi:hypothetical protein